MLSVAVRYVAEPALAFNPGKPERVGAASFLTFIVLYQTLIPISLYVSMEMVKLCHAFFISTDDGMYDERSGEHARARTSNLGEELGQVRPLERFPRRLPACAGLTCAPPLVGKKARHSSAPCCAETCCMECAACCTHLVTDHRATVAAVSDVRAAAPLA